MTVLGPEPGELVRTVSELVSAVNASSFGDSRLSLYGNTVVDDFNIVLTNQQSAGTDITVDGAGVVTFHTEGVYSIVFQGQSSADGTKFSINGTWTFDDEISTAVRQIGIEDATVPVCFVHRFALNDTVYLRFDGETLVYGAINIVRLV
jgi:hypothetical protein